MKRPRQRLRVVELPRIGRTLIVEDDVPDDAPAVVREGVARRALLHTEGRCPCGARLVMPSRRARRQAERAGRPLAASVAHEHDCPAADDVLVPAGRAWLATREGETS